MHQKLAATLGNILLDQVQGQADLTAGQAGENPIDTGSTADMILSAETAKLMRPVYEMASRVKQIEADKIKETMFGIKTGRQAANPVSRKVSDFLASRTYNRKIAPFISTLEEEMKQANRSFIKASAAKANELTELIQKSIESGDMVSANHYRKIQESLPRMLSKEEMQARAADAFKRYLTSINIAVTPEGKVLGHISRDTNELLARDIERGYNASQM